MTLDLSLNVVWFLNNISRLLNYKCIWIATQIFTLRARIQLYLCRRLLWSWQWFWRQFFSLGGKTTKKKMHVILKLCFHLGAYKASPRPAPSGCTRQTLSYALINRAHVLLWATSGWTGQHAGDGWGRASITGSFPHPGTFDTAQVEQSDALTRKGPRGSERCGTRWTRRTKPSARQGPWLVAVICIIN